MRPVTLLVIPRNCPPGIWEKQFPCARVVREGESLEGIDVSSVLVHEDVNTNHTWFHISVRLSMVPGGHMYRLQQESFDADS